MKRLAHFTTGWNFHWPNEGTVSPETQAFRERRHEQVNGAEERQMREAGWAAETERERLARMKHEVVPFRPGIPPQNK